jgi:hypothetical protein
VFPAKSAGEVNHGVGAQSMAEFFNNIGARQSFQVGLRPSQVDPSRKSDGWLRADLAREPSAVEAD